MKPKSTIYRVMKSKSYALASEYNKIEFSQENKANIEHQFLQIFNKINLSVNPSIDKNPLQNPEILNDIKHYSILNCLIIKTVQITIMK